MSENHENAHPCLLLPPPERHSKSTPVGWMYKSNGALGHVSLFSGLLKTNAVMVYAVALRRFRLTQVLNSVRIRYMLCLLPPKKGLHTRIMFSSLCGRVVSTTFRRSLSRSSPTARRRLRAGIETPILRLHVCWKGSEKLLAVELSEAGHRAV